MKRWGFGVWLALLWLVGGCASPVRELFPALPGQPARTVYVLRRGLHTGVIVRTADIPPGLWPEHRAFAGAEYLEVGWGDTLGYRFPWTSGIVMRALFASKGSVVLIHPFSGSITKEYAGIANEIIAVRLSERGFARLCGVIQDTYALNPRGEPIPLPSAYPEEEFFLARGRYSALNNCNNWTARALRAAGCPIRPRGSVLPGLVMCQSRRFGRVVWPPNRAEASGAGDVSWSEAEGRR